MKPSVAVVTSTIGRSHLRRAIESVKNQSYPCRHYIFVDGEQFFEAAREILQDYPDVVVIYLPMNTGADGWTNSSINAIAPYLVQEDLICYLDDDNWYEPDHVQKGVRALVQTQADYAYSLRHLYDLDGNYLCVDTFESLGEYAGHKQNYRFQLENQGKMLGIVITLNNQALIDTNCYLLKKDLAKHCAIAWHSGKVNDRNFYQALKDAKAKSVCTKAVTVNYIADPNRLLSGAASLITSGFNISQEQAEKVLNVLIQRIAQENIDDWGGQYIWDQTSA